MARIAFSDTLLPVSLAENGGNGFQFPSVQQKRFSVSCEFGPSLTNGGNGFQFPSVQWKRFSVSCEFGPSLTQTIVVNKMITNNNSMYVSKPPKLKENKGLHMSSGASSSNPGQGSRESEQH